MRNGNSGRYGQMAGALAGQHLRHNSPQFFGAKGGFNRSAYRAAMAPPTMSALPNSIDTTVTPTNMVSPGMPAPNPEVAQTFGAPPPATTPDLSIPIGEVPSPTPPPAAPPPSLVGDTLPSPVPGGVQNQRHYQHRLARQTGLGMNQVQNQFGQGGSWRHGFARQNPGMTAQQAGQKFGRYGGGFR